MALLFAAAACGGQGPARADDAAYWRFEGGRVDAPVARAADESARIEAVAGGPAPTLSADVPMAVLPGSSAPNHASLRLDGGWLRAKACPALNAREFTVEFWAKLGPPPAVGEAIISKGIPGPGNWHVVYRPDGSLRACIYGGLEVCLFPAGLEGPVPGTWYHLAAVYDDAGGGRTRIRAYVNGRLRATGVGAALQDTSGSDLWIGAHEGGQFAFHGLIDELRITPRVLTASEMLIGGPKPVPERAAAARPVFVAPGARIDAAARVRAKGAPILAKPAGYRYQYQVSTGGPVLYPLPAGTWDAGFASGLQGWAVLSGGSPAGYRFAVRPGRRYVVAVGFHDPATPPGKRREHVVINGQRVDTLDPAAAGSGRPFIRTYPAPDDGSGGLQVTVCHADVTDGYTAAMSVLWVFRAEDAAAFDTQALLRGEWSVPPLYYVRCGVDPGTPGHVTYPPLSADARARMAPMRPVPFDRDPDWPQPADPLDVEVRGELADRLDTYADRWGFAARDQQLPGGYLSDSGYETAGRCLETFSTIGRLTRQDFGLKACFEALLAQQDRTSAHPGSFVGGPRRSTGFIWSQGTILSGLMGYHDVTGDPRALEAARRLADWYTSYLDCGDLDAANYFADVGRFSREGATVGHLGKGGLEPLVWLYWRTKDPKVLDVARRIAALNREWGGVAWLLNGDLPPERQRYEGWHLHANLTTVRGFPWLAAATDDRSYLDDAIRACDRVWERATWGTGGVPEQIPWAGTRFPGATPDPHDEVCQTSDELQLCYLLADFTGEGRFFDRAERIYYNHIRYAQMHNGDFTAFNRLPGFERGGDAWFCCGWWGGKALYETARHLYASSPRAVTVNGYMPSAATLPVQGGTVRVDTSADIPRSGKVRLCIEPRGASRFALRLRVPGWAVLRGVAVNGETVEVRPQLGYVSLMREWRRGDRVDIGFDLPLRVEIDSSWDTLPPAKVSLEGAAPVESRSVDVFRGPALLARFRLAHGCDLCWAYTGDHPDLFENLETASDRIEAEGWSFASTAAPPLTSVRRTAQGVQLEWQVEPAPGWTLKRAALVREDRVPVQVEMTAELVAPSPEALRTVRSARLCGVRMRTQGFADYRRAALSVQGRAVDAGEVEAAGLGPGPVRLDNGTVRFDVRARGRVAVEDTGSCVGLYLIPSARRATLRAACTLTASARRPGTQAAHQKGVP